MERVLITGGKGCLAGHLTSAFREVGVEVSAPDRKGLDVASVDSVHGFFEKEGPFDLLIANAGTSIDKLLARTSVGDWDHQFEANLHGAFRCARAAVPRMKKAGKGHLIFISSGSALNPPPGQAAYAAAKAGLIGLAKSLARELGPANIRVNVILPGFFESPMTAAVSGTRKSAVFADHALSQLNDPAAVAAFVVHLHQRLPHTSGQVFQLDSRVG